MNAEDKHHMPPSQQTELDRLKGWSEALKNVVQIFAILVAGYWTYHKFIQTEAPSLETRTQVMSELNWNPSPNLKYCNANFTVHVENKGQSTFEVSSVHIRAWKFNDAPAKEDTVATFLDPLEIETGPTFFDREFTSGRLVRSYAPGVKADCSFDWAVHRTPNSMALFSADLKIKGHGKEREWTTRNSQEICGTVHSDVELKESKGLATK